MSLPPSVSPLAVIEARWQNWVGDVRTDEYIQLIPTAAIVYDSDSDYAFIREPIRLYPDADGFSSVEVIPTNDSGVTPAGWAYRCVFPRRWGVPAKSIMAPSGTTVDLFAAAGVVPTTPVMDGGFVTQAELTTGLASKVATAVYDAAMTDINGDLDALTVATGSAATAASTAQATADAAGDLAELTAADLQALIPTIPDRPKVRQRYVTDGSGSTLPNTSGQWLPVSGLGLSIPASVGDYVDLTATVMRTTSVPDAYLDVAVLVGGSPVRFLASGTSSPAPEGDPGWYISSGFPAQSGPRGFVVTSNDLDGSNVSFSVVAKSQGSGTILADSTYPAYFRAINFGPVD